MPKKKCKWCGYDWDAIIDNPKACPECKKRHPTDEVPKPAEVVPNG